MSQVLEIPQFGIWVAKTEKLCYNYSTMRNVIPKKASSANYEQIVNFFEEDPPMAEKSGVQSVERIFQLIESLAAHPAGAGLQRLAQDTDLAKSTVHRLLASLVSLC